MLLTIGSGIYQTALPKLRPAAGIALKGWIGLLLYLLTATVAKAEGSKELTANGGNRAYLSSSTTANSSYPFPTPGTMKVYVKAGETINVGSSAQGVASGTINLRAPDGSTYTSGTSTTVGYIVNRSQELAGPLPNAGGYTPYTRTVTAAQEGIWEIDFIPPNNGNNAALNPPPVAANAAWAQPYSQYITAFDVSVRNAGNTAFLTGRVFTNVLSGILGTFNVGFNAILHILTRDGYLYTFDNNGQAGNGFTFFVNNKGFENAGGNPSYKSADTTANLYVQDPRSNDSQTDITHKIFFNVPAADLPASAPTPEGTSTWLVNTPVAPAISNAAFTGTEGTPGEAGTAPLGGNISFTSTANGNYTIVIDVNQNGSYTDAVDRRLSGKANAGSNVVYWDGLDAAGNKVPAGTAPYTASISVNLFAAEVHFPFFDVERNVNGIKLTRTNGSGALDYTVYWDDSPVAIVGTPSNPLVNTTGISSMVNGHKWGTATTDPNNDNDFGNNRAIDTWAYVLSPTLTASVSFTLREADLAVSSLTAATTCGSRKVTYTAVVTNNGPSDVSGSKLVISFPNTLTGVSISRVQTQGASAITAPATTATQYTATLDISSGATRTFTLTGTASAYTTLNVTASILRPADVTDPDATNPDAAPPTDASAECSAVQSATGCNNIKTVSTVIAQAPDAGPDQTVIQNTVITLTANSAGTWSQAGSLPAVATITSPARASTTVSGLTATGTYRFVFTNGQGCADTVNVNVITTDLMIPNIVTPNGDGKNDVFEIRGINYYPGSELLIFNRWGNEVYRSENYQNTWDGSGLADGTYYYILNRKDVSGGITTFKGWLYLKR